MGSYKRVAKFYDSLFEPFNKGLRAIGMKMFPPKEGMLVLDVGCGTGIHLERYQKAGCLVYGIDLSLAMLQVARERLGENADLHLGDASQMPYPDNKFDLIIMTTVLHEMSPSVRSAVIEESKRVLDKNGRILLIDFHPGPIKPMKGWINKSIISIVEFLAWGEHFRNYRHFIKNKGLPALISAHGLSVVQERVVGGGSMALFLLGKVGEV